MQILRKFSLALCVMLSGVALTSQASTEEERNQARQRLESLNWIKSGAVPIADKAQFSVPEGYVFLNPADTGKLMEMMQNPTHGNEYFFAPDGMPWFAVLHYEDTGYVKDDEKSNRARCSRRSVAVPKPPTRNAKHAAGRR